MRLEQLECLLAVAETYSFSKAADKLFMTQQAVSLNIKQLEKELDCKLFVRARKGVILTKEGVTTVEFANRVINDKAVLLQELNKLKEQKQEQEERLVELTICSISMVTNIVIPKIIGNTYQIELPIQIKLEHSNSIYTLMENVQNSNADIGLVSFEEKELYHILEQFQNELEVEILASDELMIVLDKSQYSGELTSIKGEEFFNSKNIRTIYNAVPFEELLAYATKTYIVTSNDAEFHRNMLKKAGAMVMMSSLAYEQFFRSKKYVALPIELDDVNLIHAAVYKKDCKPLIKKLIQEIRKEIRV